MTNYVKYQCTVCRRTKDIAQDNTRVQLSACIITKGCQGSLWIVGDVKEPQQTESVTGLVDWYPRGSNGSQNAEDNGQNAITLLSGGDNGILFLAIKESDPLILNNSKIKLVLSQKRFDDISKQQYRFVSDGSSVISGKDITGKILRFNQTAINESRVVVIINGVRNTGVLLSPDTVNFDVLSTPTIGSNVEVSVYEEKDSILRELVFSLNNSSSSVSGAWGNIRYTTDNNNEKWWIYSSVEVNGLPPTARFKIEAINTESDVPLITNMDNARFLLASSPFAHVDRYLNFFVNVSNLASSYSLTTTKNNVVEMYSSAPVEELFPVFKLVPQTSSIFSSFITSDVITTSSSITTDTSAERLVGVKIIGPT